MLTKEEKKASARLGVAKEKYQGKEQEVKIAAKLEHFQNKSDRMKRAVQLLNAVKGTVFRVGV